MKTVIKTIGICLLTAGISLLLSSCKIYPFIDSFFEDSEEWEELKESIEEKTAAKDISPFHNAVYQTEGRIIMSDLARGSSEHILKLFSDQVIAEIGEDKLRNSIEKMADTIQGELLSFRTQESGGSGQRGGSGITTRTYTITMFTDMDIYELYFSKVTMDTMHDEKESKANKGIHRIVLLPVSIVYENTETGETRYSRYLDKTGVFFEESAAAARDVSYPGKGYTGYSIACLQEKFYDAARKESCETLMDLLDSVGFQGDITDISFPETDGESAARAAEGYTMRITDETGTEFFIAEARWEKNVCVQPLKIADSRGNVLYTQNTPDPERSAAGN